MPLAILGGLVAAAAILLIVAGRTAPVRAAQAAQPPAPLLNAESVEAVSSGVSALNASVIQTWTHTTRTDWEAGTLEWLDSATVSGSLQLAQRYFGPNATVTPRSGLQPSAGPGAKLAGGAR